MLLILVLSCNVLVFSQENERVKTENERVKREQLAKAEQVSYMPLLILLTGINYTKYGEFMCTLKTGEPVATATACRARSRAQGNQTKSGVEGKRNEHPPRGTHPLRAAA